MPITARRGAWRRLLAVAGGLIFLMSGIAACSGSVAASSLSVRSLSARSLSARGGQERVAGVSAGSCLQQRIQSGAQGAVLLPVSCNRPGAVKVLDSLVFAAAADPLTVSGLAGFDSRCSSAYPGATILPPSWLGPDWKRLIAACGMLVNDKQGPSGVLPEPAALVARTAKDVGSVCHWLPPSMVTGLTGVTLSHCADLSGGAIKLAAYTSDPNEVSGLSISVQLTAATITFGQRVGQEIAGGARGKPVPGLGDHAALLTPSTGRLDLEVLVGGYELGFNEEASLGIQKDALLKLARRVIGKLPSAG